ncbi:2782_t:CDS:2, partial [Cetraspora pellucida]
SRLRDKKVTGTQPIEKTTERQEIEINSNSINKKSGSTSKSKRKLGPSMIETLKPYNITNDILSLPTSATVGQILQYSNQRRNLAKILKRTVLLSETNFVNYEEGHRMTAAKCCVKIHNNPLTAVLDSEAVISIVSKRLLDKIGLEIDEEFSTVIVMVTGAKAKTGKVKNAKLVIQGITIPTTLQVLESPEETLLLGTDWFQKVNARIHFDEQKLYLKYLDNQGREKEEKPFEEKLQELLDNKGEQISSHMLLTQEMRHQLAKNFID